MSFKQINATWTGKRPLILNNGDLVDPQNPYTSQIKKLGKCASDELKEQRSRLEFDGSFYWDEKLGPVIPAANIEAVIRDGGKKSKIGAKLEGTSFVSEDQPVVKLEYPSATDPTQPGPRTRDELYLDSRKGGYCLRVSVVIMGKRIIRCRPIFPTGWSVTFALIYDASVLNDGEVVKAMVDAGALVGMGNWTPKYGRFLLS